MSEQEKDGLEKLLTVEEACDYLSILGITDHAPHPETLRDWLREGRIKGHKDSSVRGRGGAWRIKLADLIAFDPGPHAGRQGRPVRRRER